MVDDPLRGGVGTRIAFPVNGSVKLISPATMVDSGPVLTEPSSGLTNSTLARMRIGRGSVGAKPDVFRSETSAEREPPSISGGLTYKSAGVKTSEFASCQITWLSGPGNGLRVRMNKF